MFMPSGDPPTALIQHYRAAARAGKIIPELLEYESMQCPYETLDVFEDFMALNKKRQYSDAGGPSPISYQEIQAWAFSYDITLSPYKVELLDALDETWLSVWAEKNKVVQKKPKSNGR